METNTEVFALLMLLAAVVAMLAKRLRVPYSAGLVLAGIALAAFWRQPDFAVTKQLVFLVLLPPLIFEAAFHLHWPTLRRELPVILAMAVPGVVLSAGVTAFGMHLGANWAWSGAILFSVLIAATDPVSVIATFRGAGAHGRARLLVEAESLFNDGTVAVCFAVALLALGGQGVGPGLITQKLVVMVLGSLFCGLVTSSWILLISTRTDDHLLEITLATVAAYASFLLAEHLKLSGVLATLAAGILFGNAGGGSRGLSPKGREAIEAVFEYLAFIANSLIFLLIGMHEAAQPFASLLRPVGIAIAVVTLGRAAAVYPLCAVFGRTRLRVDMRHQHILFWGGLRGSLALALALTLPADLPHRNDIVTTAFAVVAFSIFVQGATMSPLLRRLGELAPRHPVHPSTEQGS